MSFLEHIGFIETVEQEHDRFTSEPDGSVNHALSKQPTTTPRWWATITRGDQHIVMRSHANDVITWRCARCRARGEGDAEAAEHLNQCTRLLERDRDSRVDYTITTTAPRAVPHAGAAAITRLGMAVWMLVYASLPIINWFARIDAVWWLAMSVAAYVVVLDAAMRIARQPALGRAAAERTSPVPRRVLAVVCARTTRIAGLGTLCLASAIFHLVSTRTADTVTIGVAIAATTLGLIATAGCVSLMFRLVPAPQAGDTTSTPTTASASRKNRGQPDMPQDLPDTVDTTKDN